VLLPVGLSYKYHPIDGDCLLSMWGDASAIEYQEALRNVVYKAPSFTLPSPYSGSPSPVTTWRNVTFQVRSATLLVYWLVGLACLEE